MQTMAQANEQVVALAAVAQASFLVQQLAMHGMVAKDKLDTAIHSLFALNPPNTEAVFGSVRQLRIGLETLRDFLGPNDSWLSPSESLRYSLSILHLEAQLATKPAMQQQIRQQLEKLQSTSLGIVWSEDNVSLHNLAKIYRNTLSTLPFRIHVRGDMNHLKNELNADKIRILLFAGVRAAFLWRQLGGRRWHLLLKRGQLEKALHSLLLQPNS
jgi:high frequency lysogenization protein